MRFLLVAVFGLMLAAPAEAGGLHPDCNILWPCEAPQTHARKAPAGRVRASVVRFRHAPATTHARRLAPRPVGLVPELAAKVGQIVGSCRARVISAVRHTFIAGTRRVSLHAYGRAVDIAGDPSCVYAMLSGWPGGYSLDAGRMGHIHVSYEPNGREWGARFYHGGGHRRRHGHRRR